MSRHHWSGYGTTFAEIIWTSAWLLLPYLAWVTFAAALNFTIWRLNARQFREARGLGGPRPTKVAAIVLANKIARMAWAMMAKGERYKEPVALAA